MTKIGITTGDPNGIGCEITIKALNTLDLPADKIILLTNKKVLDYYGKINKNYEIIEIPYNSEIHPGKITTEAGEYSYNSVKTACEVAKSGKISAIVTAPVAKSSMNLAGHKFMGQTEILQKYLSHNNQKAEMLFVAGNFKVLLLTRHCALKDIFLTRQIVIEKIQNLNKFFKEKFHIQNPKFALCAFNPHAGEGGIMGLEERDILTPAVNILRTEGISITQPLAADTLFIDAAKEYYKNSTDRKSTRL